MTTTRLTNERQYELMEAYGFTDEQMKEVLRSRGFKDLDVEITLAEVASNLGYLWSFRLQHWFHKNQTFLDGVADQEDYDALLDEIRNEDERK